MKLKYRFLVTTFARLVTDETEISSSGFFEMSLIFSNVTVTPEK